MTEAQRLADEKVEVIVKPHNRYGEAQAGERLYVTRAELASHGRCLALVQEAQAPRPRTAVIALPAEIAKRHGLPLGRRQEGPIVYEVTRLRPDGKQQLLTRQELEQQTRGAGAPSEAQDLAAAFGWEEEDGDPAAWIKVHLPRIKKSFEDAHYAAAQANREIATVKLDTSVLRETIEKVRAEVEKAKAAAAEQLAAKDAELAKLQEDLTKSRAEARALTAELAAAKAAPAAAPAPEQTPAPAAAAPAKAKAKE